MILTFLVLVSFGYTLILKGCAWFGSGEPDQITRLRQNIDPYLFPQMATSNSTKIYDFLTNVSDPSSKIQGDALQEITGFYTSTPEAFRDKEVLHVGVGNPGEFTSLQVDSTLEKTYTLQDNNHFTVTYFERRPKLDAPNPVLTFVYRTPQDYREEPDQLTDAQLVVSLFVKTDSRLQKATFYALVQDEEQFNPEDYRVVYAVGNPANENISAELDLTLLTTENGFETRALSKNQTGNIEVWGFVQVNLLSNS